MTEDEKDALAARLGIVRIPALTGEDKEKAREINDLLDALVYRTNIREWELFEKTYPTEGLAAHHLSRFLRDIRTCPAEVIAEAERLLALKHEDELAHAAV